MWYILNYIPPLGKKRSDLGKRMSRLYPSLDIFAPTFVQLVTAEGKVKKTEKPLLYHYIFVKGEEREIKKLCREEEGFSFVLDRTQVGRHLSISDSAMEQFRIIAHYHSGKLPCYPLDGISLEEGDEVEIVSGACAGLKGTFVARKGSKSGNIMLSLDGSMAAIVYDVKAEYVKVLKFAKDSRRIYDQLDAFTLKILPYFREEAPPVSIKDIAACNVFISRLDAVKLNNPKVEAKLMILLYAAYRLLSRNSEAHIALEKYNRLSSYVTNHWTKILSSLIIGNLDEAKKLLERAKPKKLSAIQNAIVKSITE